MSWLMRQLSATILSRLYHTKTRQNKNDDNHVFEAYVARQIRASVRWISEQSKGQVLSSNHVTEIKIQDGSLSSMSVLEVLKLKHSEPQCPPASALIKCDNLPSRMNLIITGSHIHYVASRIQGSAGRTGAHSDRLCDSVATLVHRLSNSIVSWVDIRALMACRLVALDKSSGVRPIGIGDT